MGFLVKLLFCSLTFFWKKCSGNWMFYFLLHWVTWNHLDLALFLILTPSRSCPLLRLHARALLACGTAPPPGLSVCFSGLDGPKPLIQESRLRPSAVAYHRSWARWCYRAPECISWAPQRCASTLSHAISCLQLLLPITMAWAFYPSPHTHPAVAESATQEHREVTTFSFAAH